LKRKPAAEEAGLLDELSESIDELAKEHGFTVFWDEPLSEERRA